MYGPIPLGKDTGPWGGRVHTNMKVKEPEELEILVQGFLLSLAEQGKWLPPSEAVAACFLSSGGWFLKAMYKPPELVT